MKLLEEIISARTKTTPGQNSMGVSESYYNPSYLIARCFTDLELSEMSEDTLKSVYRLATYATEVFY